MGNPWRWCSVCHKRRAIPGRDVCRRCHGEQILHQLDVVMARGHGDNPEITAIIHESHGVTEETCWICREAKAARERLVAAG